MDTQFKDSMGNTIKIGDDLDIVATNMYSGTVNLTDGIICLQTAFFNLPLHEHLEAIDLQYVLIDEKIDYGSGDILPF